MYSIMFLSSEKRFASWDANGVNTKAVIAKLTPPIPSPILKVLRTLS